jgi:hypothetical protein
MVETEREYKELLRRRRFYVHDASGIKLFLPNNLNNPDIAKSFVALSQVIKPAIQLIPHITEDAKFHVTVGMKSMFEGVVVVKTQPSDRIFWAKRVDNKHFSRFVSRPGWSPPPTNRITLVVVQHKRDPTVRLLSNIYVGEFIPSDNPRNKDGQDKARRYWRHRAYLKSATSHMTPRISDEEFHLMQDRLASLRAD